MKFATGPEDLVPLAKVAEIGGLAYMQGVLSGEFPAPAIAQTLGYTMHSVDAGRVAFRGAPEFKTTNPLGTVHGGWYGTLLDSAMACAVMTKLAPNTVYTTLEYKINIIRPIKLGTEIECVGIASHVGRSTGVATGEIRGVSDDRLYATGSTTCIVMSAPKS